MSNNEYTHKILMVGPLPPTVGGITTFIKGVLNSELTSEYCFKTFGTERPTQGIFKDVNDYTLMFRIGLVYLLKSALFTAYHLIKFPFTFIGDQVSIVHINTSTYWSFWENVIYLLISKMFKKKTIFHIHGSEFDKFYDGSNSLIKFFISKSLNYSDIVIVLSLKWKKYSKKIISRNNIIILKNFVNLSDISCYNNKIIDIFQHLNNNMIKVLFIGGVAAKRKGFYDVLRTIPIILESNKNIFFIFINCKHLNGISNILNKEDFSSHIKFLGYVIEDEKKRLFHFSDIFILPSYAEGLPITMLEAMAAKLPVIATSVGAIPEVIIDGMNGFIINVGNYKMLAEKILLLAKDNELRQKMQIANFKKIQRYFDRPIIMKRLDNIYKQLI